MLFSIPLIEIQMTLIGIGVLFQIFAFTALRRERVGHREPKRSEALKRPAIKPREDTVEPRRTKLPAREGDKDYYEMEGTPPGVRPGDLTRTAKVKYIS